MIPFLIGAAIKIGAEAQADHRRNQLQKAMQAYQQSKALANEAAIQKLVAQNSPTAHAAELANTVASREAGMRTSVDNAAAAAPVSVPAGASADYTKASATAADTVSSRTARAISQLGTMGAPGEQSLASGIRFGRAAGNVDANNTALNNVGDAYMDMINHTVANPYANLAGSALMGFDSPGAKKADSAAPTTGGWTKAMGTSGEYEDSAGNMQRSPFARQSLMQRAFKAWGK